jgi:uncharacterized protein
LAELITDLQEIESLATELEIENDQFKIFIKTIDGSSVDKIVFSINADISPQIDCTKCGNCCRVLMIHITEEETEKLSLQLNLPVNKIKEKYIETSEQGQMILNKMPCTFLNDRKCTIYDQRFTECREFPHLHKENFKNRIFSTMMYYAICPIIFNVVEALKEKINFK